MMMPKSNTLLLLSLLLFLQNLFTGCGNEQPDYDHKELKTHLVPVEQGWAGNSINTVIFRRNSVVSHQHYQYVAYYNERSQVVLAKRKIGSNDWEIKTTAYKGNIHDAHNSISIMVDGDGYLHLSWDHHGHPLRYCKSVEPESLELTKKLPMTGELEKKVTYPEFYRVSNGDLIFLYRDGSSGNGDLILKYYDLLHQKWSMLHAPLIDGEGERNAYWQMCTDLQGGIHLSWVWRSTGDVATNHNIGYAKASDGGITWQKSNGEKYNLPIMADNAEYAALIPKNHELINTTSMCADRDGNPYIATYWRRQGTEIPQFFILHKADHEWKTQQVTKRTTPFSLSGFGTKSIPVSRPQVLIDNHSPTPALYMIYRDEERNNAVSIAACNDIQKRIWKIEFLHPQSVGKWEPTYDTELWKKSGLLNLFLQYVEQGDGEAYQEIVPTDISILEWRPSR